MRMCLDQIKSARHQRETYIGPWLPDPVVEDEQQEDVTLPLMLALERLSPLERAAFLLHDVFGLEFDEIAKTIQREPAACRQLATRARTHVRESRPRFQVEKERGLAIAQAFFDASRTGDMSALGAMLVDQVWYLTVTRGSNWLVDFYCRLRKRTRGRGDAAEYFRRYGGATIILGRFFTVVRVFVWPAAASHGVGYGRFVILDVIGALSWASIWVLVGWLVGDQWETAAKAVGGWTTGIGIALVLALGIPLAFRFVRRARA